MSMERTRDRDSARTDQMPDAAVESAAIQTSTVSIAGKLSRLDSKAALILVLLCASWGLSQTSVKVANLGVSPVLQAGIRSLGSAVLLLLWMQWRRIPLFERDGTLLWGIVVGVLFTLEFLLIYLGLAYTNASRGVLFVYTAPFVVALGAHLCV